MWPQNVSNTYIITFIAVTLTLSFATAIAINITPQAGGFAGILLVIPAMVALSLNIMHNRGFSQVYKAIFTGASSNSLAFAVIYPLGFTTAVALLATIAGSAKLNTNNLPIFSDIVVSLIGIILAMIISFGEEYGWRGFLLPALTSRYGKLKATVIVGIVWMAYQVPAMYLIADLLGSENALLLSIIQGAVLFTLSFPLSYCYYLAKGSIIPVLLWRGVFDVTNTFILGDGTEGVRTLISGHYSLFNTVIPLELLLGIIAILWFIKKLQSQ